MRKTVSSSITIFLALSALFLTGGTFGVYSANAQSVNTGFEEIHITADGSIIPSTAPIQRNGDIYTLTADIVSAFGANGIIVERNNIILDGAGHKLESEGCHDRSARKIYHTVGIDLTNDSNVTIVDAEINLFYDSIVLSGSSRNKILDNIINVNQDGEHGIDLRSNSEQNSISGNKIVSPHSCISINSSTNNAIVENDLTGDFILQNSHYNKIFQNDIKANARGIALQASHDNTLRDNIFSIYALDISGNSISDFVNDVDSSNQYAGKPIYYWVDVHDQKVPSDAAYVCLVSCSGITIENIRYEFSGPRILLVNTTNSLIAKNYAKGTDLYFLNLTYSNNNRIIENFINTNMVGIFLTHSLQNFIAENNLVNNSMGAVLVYSSQNTISYNNVSANSINGISNGLSFENSSENTIFNNSIVSNYGYGIKLTSSSGNKFYHNAFINNNPQVASFNSTNLWDDGPVSGGNYWSDLADDESVYVIDANNQDNYPLNNFGKQYVFPIETILVLLLVAVVASSTLIYFTVVKRKRST
ncbi:MAG: NosD domain-containing protein [Candidatus Bathyarchaeia archaeon]|jgi:parallel beta-helix repeat protein